MSLCDELVGVQGQLLSYGTDGFATECYDIIDTSNGMHVSIDVRDFIFQTETATIKSGIEQGQQWDNVDILMQVKIQPGMVVCCTLPQAIQVRALSL